MKTQTPKEQSVYSVIETEQLLLRMFRAEDLDTAYKLFSDADVQKYLAPENIRTLEQTKSTLRNLVRRWEERNFGIWCVTHKNSGEAAGYCGFQYFEDTSDVELVFAFLKNYWGNGLATEAAKACLRYWLEELTLEKIVAATSQQNIGSQRVLEKIGMNFVEKSAFHDIDAVTYSVSREEYQTDGSFYKLSRVDFNDKSNQADKNY